MSLSEPVAASPAEPAFVVPVELARMGRNVGFTEDAWLAQCRREHTIENNLRNMEILKQQHSDAATMKLEDFDFGGLGQPAADIAHLLEQAGTQKSQLTEEFEFGVECIETCKEKVNEDVYPNQVYLEELTRRRGVALGQINERREHLAHVWDSDKTTVDILGEELFQSLRPEQRSPATKEVRRKAILKRFHVVMEQDRKLLRYQSWRKKLNRLLKYKNWAADFGQQRTEAEALQQKVLGVFGEAEARQRELSEKLRLARQRKDQVNEEEADMAGAIKQLLKELMERAKSYTNKRVEQLCMSAIVEKLEGDFTNTQAEVQRAKEKKDEALSVCSDYAEEADRCKLEGEKLFAAAASSACESIWPRAVACASNCLIYESLLDLALQDKQKEIAKQEAKKVEEDAKAVRLRARLAHPDDDHEAVVDELQTQNGIVQELESSLASGANLRQRIVNLQATAQRALGRLQELQSYGQTLGEAALRAEAAAAAEAAFGVFPGIFSFKQGTAAAENNSLAILPEFVTTEIEELRRQNHEKDAENARLRADYQVMMERFKLMMDTLADTSSAAAAESAGHPQLDEDDDGFEAARRRGKGKSKGKRRR